MKDKEKERKVVIIEGPEAAFRRFTGTPEEWAEKVAWAKAFDEAAKQNVLKRYNELVERKKK